MDLKAKFQKAYGIEYKEPSEADERFVSDVRKIISYMDEHCDFLTFELSNLTGNASSVLLICRDADETKDRAVGVSLTIGHEREGQGIHIDQSHGDMYLVDEHMHYIADEIVTKVARDFAVKDMRNANLEAMKKGFGLS